MFVAIALLLPTACGSSENDPPNTDQAGGRAGEAGDDGGGGTTSGTGGSNGGSSASGGSSGTSDPGGAGGEGGGPDIDELAPLVTIESPDALEHPSDGPVLVGTDVIVLCKAVRSSDRGAEDVDPGSVQIEMLDADGTHVGEPLQGVPNGRDDEYIATFGLVPIENGKVSFRCTASDISGIHTGTGAISTLVDHGPTIRVVRPTPDSVYPQLGSVHFQIEVEPAPLVTRDDEAEVDSVTLEVADEPITLVEESPGVYGADVNFSDTMLFGNALEGSVPLVVTASNRRIDPGPVTRTVGYPFIVDGEGPIITITDPANQAIVGGRVTLTFTVVDELARVDPAKVTVRVNLETHTFMDDPASWAPVQGDEYRFTFDSRLIENSVTQATITVAAEDYAQNAAPIASLLVYLDNKPPIVDLDPSDIREQKGSQASLFCSLPFDPLGASPNDLAVVHEAIPFLRTLVWDETNGLVNAIPRVALPDRDTVYLYLQKDSTQPIIEDSDDADTVCDRINPAVTTPPLQLTAIPPAGDAWFGPQDEDINPDPPMGTCPYQGNDTRPNLLCTNQVSDLTRVTQYDLVPEPVVYGIGDLLQPVCTGDYWEIQQFDLQEGWICLAATATDNVGNRAVSRPLRVCYDDTRTSTIPSCIDGQNPPSCAAGCTLPRVFEDYGDRILTISR